jgi:hypothetical protein
MALPRGGILRVDVITQLDAHPPLSPENSDVTGAIHKGQRSNYFNAPQLLRHRYAYIS